MVNLMVQRDGSANSRCNCCGRQGHSSDRTSREKDCPAFGRKCLKCGKQDHFKNVCKSKAQPKKTDIVEVTKDEASDIEATGAFVIDQCEFSVDQEPSTPTDNGLSFGEAAGLLYCMGKVDKEVKSMGKQQVPHRLYEQLQWVTKSPPRHPTCNLSVSISSSGYRASGFKPPSAYKRRDAQLTALADTGCQAVCMGRTQLQSLGFSAYPY